MTEQNTAIERITTVEDGEGTVNENLSTGGPGPDGQLDTVVERLSGAPDEPTQPEPEAKDDEKPAEKAAAKRAPAKKKS